MTKETRKAKLATLYSVWNGPRSAVLEAAIAGNEIPGICLNEGCDCCKEVFAPDQNKGHCHRCDTPTVVSVLVLEGMV